MTTLSSHQLHTDLIYHLRGLGMAGAILHIGAHPDDEDVGMVAYMARKFGARVVYWSATRGEGGQNRIGPYQGAALGVYRTWESLAARTVDGGEALFGPFVDFGFSKHAAEALNKWGRERAVREIVRAIRLVQPAIVVGRWQGTPGDGHGHHQAIGEATLEAFAAAGDPASFPELGEQGLAAWQPRKLYLSTMGDWQPGEKVELGRIIPAFERDGVVRLNSGEYDPISGRTYQEQAWIGFNAHQTQAMGVVPASDDFYYYYSLHTGLVAVPPKETGFYDNLDPTLTGLADYPGNNSPFLRARLSEIKARASAAFERYRPDNPLEAAGPLLEGASLLRELRAVLPAQPLEAEVRRALSHYLARKTVDFDVAAAGCLGLRLECLSDDAHITPGQSFHLSARLWNHRGVRLDRVDVSPHLPEAWMFQATQAASEETDHCQIAYTVTAAETAELSCVYWLRDPAQAYCYTWPSGEPASRPFASSLVEVGCRVTLGHHHLELRQPAVLRQGFAGGFRELPMAVIPPISLHPETPRFMLQTAATAQSLTLNVVARSNTEHTGVAGVVTLQAPAGWRIEPAAIELALGSVGDARTLQFTATIPPGAEPGECVLRYSVRVGSRDYGVVLDPVRMGAPGLPQLPDEATCVKEVFITRPAQVIVQLLDVTFAPGLKYAYVKGAADTVLSALSQFGLDVYPIADHEMGFIALGQFDAVIIGPNAYLVRDELRKNAARFLEYVNEGGTLVVQYQGYGYQEGAFTPYPFRYHQPHDRVTYEDAPMTLLQPDHALFNQPNKLGAADFEGWVMERGLYFFGEWDRRYVPLLACHDPGEEAKAGGMLIAGYGRGTYVYAAYSFFRQLPAGVPGALRLLANLVALPATHTPER